MMPLTCPWNLGKVPLENAQNSTTGAKAWVEQKLEETDVVIITGAIIAAVASAALSWSTAPTWPWTATATVYSSLMLSLVSVYTGCQQHIAILRYGKHDKGERRIHEFLSSHSIQSIVWSVPLILLNLSILLLIVSILIIILARATQTATFDQDAKIAIVSGIAGLFGMICVVTSMFQGVYRLPKEKFTGEAPQEVQHG